MSKNTEEEQALVIRSDDPQAVVDRIMSDIIKLDRFALVTAPPQDIVDTYYDTPDRDLKKAKTSLRVRLVNGQPYITVKGKSDGFGDEQRRSEWESEWPWETPEPQDVLALFDMKVVQERVTNRLVKDVHDSKDKWNRVAELAIDDVTYDFESLGNARFFEVEVELKDPTSKVLLKDIVKPLKEAVPELESWKYSKLTTGKAIEFALGIRVDESGLLKNASFDVIKHLATLK